MQMHVQDIMSTDVATIAPDVTVRELVRLLDARKIGGVPVVESGNGVVGVVSGSDVFRLASSRSQGDRRPKAPEEQAGAAPTPEQPGDFYRSLGETPWTDEVLETESELRLFDRHRVAEIMTPGRFSVRPDFSVPQLARFLLRCRIHRALVMENGELQGIVTSVDVLRAVAND